MYIISLVLLHIGYVGLYPKLNRNVKNQFSHILLLDCDVIIQDAITKENTGCSMATVKSIRICTINIIFIIWTEMLPRCSDFQLNLKGFSKIT